MSACLTGCGGEASAERFPLCTTCAEEWEKSPEKKRAHVALMDFANRIRAERAAKTGTP